MSDSAIPQVSKGISMIAAAALLASLLLSACGGGMGYGMGGGSNTGTSSGYGGSSGAVITLTLHSASIEVGQSSTLSWSVSGATACTASGAWSGNEALTGTKTFAPTTAGTFTYTLSCSGMGASSSKSAVLQVGPVGTSNGPYTLTALVANVAGTAALSVDPALVNPWGIVFAPNAPVWVANNGSATSTLYDGSGNPQPAATPLVVKFAAGAGGAFAPTGTVANSSSDFVVSSGGKSGAASFIYAGEHGMLAGWSSAVDPSNAVTVYVDAGGAEYTGLALATSAGQNFLYAADFHNAKVDVFDATFGKLIATSTRFAFADPSLPMGYAPFGIQAIANGGGGAVQVYVTYAERSAAANSTAIVGAGAGLVDVFDANGTLLKHLIAKGGVLNAPWGIALAPADFGPLGNALLIGNLGDGKINAFDASSGNALGAVSDSSSHPIALPGLWGIAFGNDSAGEPHNTLFIAAGTDEGVNGEYARIDVGATPPMLGH